jgi:purine-nucleoside phosphorylase
VLTISDHIVTGESLPSDQREKSFGAMVEIALEAAFA